MKEVIVGSPAAVPHLRRLCASRAVMRGFTALSLVVVVIALWSSLVGVVIDVALLAVAVRAGGLSRAGAQR